MLPSTYLDSGCPTVVDIHCTKGRPGQQERKDIQSLGKYYIKSCRIWANLALSSRW